MSRKGLGVLAGLLVLAGAAPCMAQADAPVVREAVGNRLAELTKMELKPFPAEAWSKLQSWSSAAPLTQGATDGKVVVIVTWDDLYSTSVRAVATAKRLADKHKDGVVVVAVHNAEGWQDAKKPATEKEGNFILAHDAKGEFRTTLRIDDAPDFYLVDRAGQLRYADITTETVEQAVDFLVKEDAKSASTVNERLAAEAKARAEAQRRTDAIRTNVDLVGMPEVPFTAPDAERYKKAVWPVMPRDPNAPPVDPKNPDPPIVMSIPDTGFFPSKPELNGRAIVLYFWHPDVRETFQIMPYFDMLQKQNKRDLVVIGVLCPLKGPNGQELKLENDIDHIKKRFEDFQRSYNIGHTFVVDLSGALLAQATNRNQTEIPLPWIAVISTDKTLRWGGWLGLPAAKGAIDKVLANDPGVNARRKAEDEYLKSKSK